MAKDLYFDINTRDILIENGDFALIENCSVQNGSILKEARAFDPLSPNWGVGLMEIINAPISVVNYEMNRWVAQAHNDGAKIARYTISNANKITVINIEVAY